MLQYHVCSIIFRRMNAELEAKTSELVKEAEELLVSLAVSRVQAQAGFYTTILYAKNTICNLLLFLGG